MNRYQLILLGTYLLVQGFQYWLRRINLSHLKKYGTEVPVGFGDYIDQQTLKKTAAYTIESDSLSSIESLFSSVILLIFLFGGLLNYYNSWIASLDLPFVISGLLFFLLLNYAGTVLSVPFSLYRTFKIENRFGFNTMTMRLWLADLAKSVLISTLLYSIMLICGFFIIQKSPDHWWLFAWIFLFVFSIFIMYIAPYVIEPLFNKFTPLEGEVVEEKIREMMKKAGIRVSRVFTMDASRRSRHTNAYFTGIGKVKRIVLYDTLTQMMSLSEIIAVLAHEAGHWKKKHVLKMIALFETLSLAGLYVVFRVTKTGFLSSVFGLQHETVYAQLFILAFIFGMVSFSFTPLFSYLSRRHEHEADRFAVELTSDKEGLATSLIKLSKDNLSNLHPHPLYARFYYSHPPIVERVQGIRSMPI